MSYNIKIKIEPQEEFATSPMQPYNPEEQLPIQDNPYQTFASEPDQMQQTYEQPQQEFYNPNGYTGVQEQQNYGYQQPLTKEERLGSLAKHVEDRYPNAIPERTGFDWAAFLYNFYWAFSIKQNKLGVILLVANTFFPPYGFYLSYKFGKYGYNILATSGINQNEEFWKKRNTLLYGMVTGFCMILLFLLVCVVINILS